MKEGKERKKDSMHVEAQPQRNGVLKELPGEIPGSDAVCFGPALEIG